MAICCGLLILGALLIDRLNIVSPSMETVFAVLCFIGMGAMMLLMSNNRRGSDPSYYQTHSYKDKQIFEEHKIQPGQGSIFGSHSRFLGKTGRPFKGRNKTGKNEIKKRSEK